MKARILPSVRRSVAMWKVCPNNSSIPVELHYLLSYLGLKKISKLQPWPQLAVVRCWAACPLSALLPLQRFGSTHHLAVLRLLAASCSAPCTCSYSVWIQGRGQHKEESGLAQSGLGAGLQCLSGIWAALDEAGAAFIWVAWVARELSSAPRPQCSLSGIWMVYLTPQQGLRQRAAPSPCLSWLWHGFSKQMFSPTWLRMSAVSIINFKQTSGFHYEW